MTLEEIAEKEGLIYLLNQLFIDMVKEGSAEKRFDIRNDNWELIVETHHEFLSKKLKEKEEAFNEKFKSYPHKLTGKEIDPIEILAMTNPHKQSAEAIVSLIISNTASQYSEEWKPDKVYTKEELIKIVESFAKQEVKKAEIKAQDKVLLEACNAGVLDSDWHDNWIERVYYKHF